MRSRDFRSQSIEIYLPPDLVYMCITIATETPARNRAGARRAWCSGSCWQITTESAKELTVLGLLQFSVNLIEPPHCALDPVDQEHTDGDKAIPEYAHPQPDDLAYLFHTHLPI